jgi:hypothetical protein
MEGRLDCRELGVGLAEASSLPRLSLLTGLRLPQNHRSQQIVG